MATTEHWDNAPHSGRAAARRRGSPVARLRAWLGGAYTPYLCIAPFFAVFFAFFAYPVAYSFYVSLQHWSGIGPMRSVGFDNYTFVLSDSFFWNAVDNTALLWLLVVPPGIVLSLLIAVALNRARFRGRAIATMLYLLPTVSSIVAVAFVFKIFFDQDYGPVNIVLGTLHLPHVPWLTSEAWSKPTLALVRLWASVGLGALFFYAAMQNISQDLYEAAAMDGCNPLRQFWAITLPLLSRTILFIAIVGTLAVLSLFAEPQLITNNGGPGTSSVTLGYYLYTFINNLDYGTASAVSFLTTMAMMIVSIALFLIARRWPVD